MKESFTVKLAGEDVILRPDNCGVQLFRGSDTRPNAPEQDYIDVWQIDDEAGTEKHAWYFNPLAARWLGGLALRDEDIRELRKAERQHGSFRKQTGWNPRVEIDDVPTPFEDDLFVKSQTDVLDDDEQLRKDLHEALKGDF